VQQHACIQAWNIGAGHHTSWSSTLAHAHAHTHAQARSRNQDHMHLRAHASSYAGAFFANWASLMLVITLAQSWCVPCTLGGVEMITIEHTKNLPSTHATPCDMPCGMAREWVSEGCHVWCAEVLCLRPLESECLLAILQQSMCLHVLACACMCLRVLQGRSVGWSLTKPLAH